jgi:MoxR-like ATPase
VVEVNKAANLYQTILGEVSKVVVGKSELKEAMVIALIAGGHILIEGPPGSAKTTLANSFAKVIGGTFKRIQLTPDMMPADITGFYLYSTNGNSNFVPGPIFANLVLADELNRTTPRTQSALLEAMQDCQVTIERETYPLKKPFMLIATQLQSGAEGTYPLTEVQIDRFLLRVISEYPSTEEERRVLSNIDRIEEPDIHVVTGIEEIMSIQKLAKEVNVAPAVNEYIVSIIDNLRRDPDVQSGPSTRAGIALYKCSRVLALFDGRDYVIPDDIKHLLSMAVEHRIRVKAEAEMDNVTPRMILERTLEKLPVPTLTS